ncbi:MAG: EamA family transporter [Deltaproteobacteria bacterium]
MDYVIGFFMVLFKSIVSVFSKKHAEEINIKTHLFILSVLNFIYILVLFKNLYNLIPKILFGTSIYILLFLLSHFSFRILTNISQMKIYARKDIDLNMISAFISTNTIISLASYFVMQHNFKLYVFCAFILANLGVVIMTLDKSNGKINFYFKKDIIFIVLINYFTSGVKAIMINVLLNHFSPIEMVLLDVLNYFIVFGIMYRSQIKDITAEPFKYKFYPIIVLLNVIAIFLEVRLTMNIELFCIIQFLTPVLTLILSIWFLNSKLTKRQLMGIMITTIGVTVTKIE